VPHATPREHLDGVPAAVGFRLRLVYGAHAAGAERVTQGERPQDEPLGLALQETVRLELAENPLADEVFGQGGRFRPRVLLQELPDDLVELAAVQQIATA